MKTLRLDIIVADKQDLSVWPTTTAPRPWNEFQCLRDSLNCQLSGWPKCWWNGWLRCQQQIGSVKIGNQWCRHAGSVCLLTQQLIHRWRRTRLRGWLNGWLNNLLNCLLNYGLKGRLNQKRYSRARNLMCSFRTYQISIASATLQNHQSRHGNLICCVKTYEIPKARITF